MTVCQSERLRDLVAHDVSIWLDNINRDKLQDGTLQRLIATRHVVGVTSNPTIFMQAIVGSDAYDDQLLDLARRNVSSVEAARALIARDIRSACDALDTVFRATTGRDGRGLHRTATTIATSRTPALPDSVRRKVLNGPTRSRAAHAVMSLG